MCVQNFILNLFLDSLTVGGYLQSGLRLVNPFIWIKDPETLYRTTANHFQSAGTPAFRFVSILQVDESTQNLFYHKEFTLSFPISWNYKIKLAFF
jgi:hypothetical protein